MIYGWRTMVRYDIGEGRCFTGSVGRDVSAVHVGQIRSLTFLPVNGTLTFDLIFPFPSNRAHYTKTRGRGKASQYRCRV
jgi:hypothetical protein